MTYPAVVLLGFGFSSMVVNALSFAADLIGENKVIKFDSSLVLTKTRSKMTTAISFSHQNDIGSLARALCLMENS